MKRLLTLILCLIASQLAFAQKTDTLLFNGVTKIIINNDKSADENYKLTGKIMLDQGYNIGNKDAEFHQISTEPVRVLGQGVTHMLSIYAVSKDNQITITGKSKSTSTLKVVAWQEKETSVEVVPYKKSRLLAKSIFDKLTKLAKALGSDITYSE